MMPITPVACQTRGFYTEDRTHLAGADRGYQLLESGPVHETGPRASEIIVNNVYLGKAELASMINQTVLPPLTLKVMDYLTRAGLTNIDDGVATEAFSS
jgi:hypothetical protein